MYHIKSIQVNEQGVEALFLVSENNRDFWTDWKQDKRTLVIAKNFIELFIRIVNNGTRWAIATGKLKILDGNRGLIEMKNFGGVQRVLCYIHAEEPVNMVMLEEFEGHKGGSKIPASTMKRCSEKAAKARRLLEGEDSGKDA